MHSMKQIFTLTQIDELWRKSTIGKHFCFQDNAKSWQADDFDLTNLKTKNTWTIQNVNPKSALISCDIIVN
jgi:hypothetical protein